MRGYRFIQSILAVSFLAGIWSAQSYAAVQMSISRDIEKATSANRFSIDAQSSRGTSEFINQVSNYKPTEDYSACTTVQCCADESKKDYDACNKYTDPIIKGFCRGGANDRGNGCICRVEPSNDRCAQDKK